MCLGIPVKIKKISGSAATVESGGVRKEVNIAFVPKAKAGDYVILHAGFAIQILDEKEALLTLRDLDEIAKAGK